MKELLSEYYRAYMQSEYFKSVGCDHLFLVDEELNEARLAVYRYR